MNYCAIAGHRWDVQLSPNARKCKDCRAQQVRTPNGHWVDRCALPVKTRIVPIEGKSLWGVEKSITERYTEGNKEHE